MNAAFLMVATAWFAGADAAPAKPEKINNPPAAAPATMAPPAAYSGGSCGGDCGSCGGCDTCGCEEGCGKHGLRAKLKGMFHRSKSCGCDTCEAAPACNTCAAPAPTCNTCAAPAPTCGCDTCDTCEGHGHGLLSKLKGKFHHKSECCDTCDTCGGCDTCGAGMPATGAPLPKIEGAPKTGGEPAQKMPVGIVPSVKPVGLEAAPVAAPNVIIESEKSPF